MNVKNFFTELKRRNVYKVAVTYAVVGWLVAQIATQVFPFLEIPNWVVRLVIVLIATGFPIALVIAWAFEATPEYVPAYSMAVAQASFGNKDEAIRLLEKSYEDHAPFDSEDLGWILVDHRLD